MINIIKNDIYIGRYINGNSINVISYLLDSGKSGNHFFIQGGIHGGELTFDICFKLYHFLRKYLLNGKVTIIPIANPISWLQRIYNYTAGKFDFYSGKDWNRNYPGSLNGDLGQKISYHLFKLASESSFAVDLHTSRKSLPFGISASKKYLKYIKILGLEYNYLYDGTNPVYKGALSTELTKKNIANITIECGSHDEYNEINTTTVYNGILRLLNELNMIKSDEVIINSINNVKYFERINKVYAPDSGFIKFKKSPNEIFQKGEVLFEICNPNNLTKYEGISLPYDGLAWKFANTNICWCGDEVIQAINEKDIKTL